MYLILPVWIPKIISLTFSLISSSGDQKCVPGIYCTRELLDNNTLQYSCGKSCDDRPIIVHDRESEGIKTVGITCTRNYSELDYIKWIPRVDDTSTQQIILEIQHCPIPREPFVKIFNAISIKLTTDFTFTIAKLPTGSQTLILDSYNFRNFSSVKILRLPNDNIEELPEQLFADMFNLERLYLNGNRLRSLPVKIFEPLKNLKVLDLSGNRFTSLDGELFQNLSSLQNLILSSNELDNLSGSTFNSLTGLLDLQLSYNNMSILNDGIFDNLKNLEVLNLSENKLIRVPESPFIYNSKLKNLDLIHAFFDRKKSQLKAKLLKNLTSLKKISFSIEFDGGEMFIVPK